MQTSKGRSSCCLGVPIFVIVDVKCKSTSYHIPAIHHDLIYCSGAARRRRESISSINEPNTLHVYK